MFDKAKYIYIQKWGLDINIIKKSLVPLLLAVKEFQEEDQYAFTVIKNVSKQSKSFEMLFN